MFQTGEKGKIFPSAELFGMLAVRISLEHELGQVMDAAASIWTERFLSRRASIFSVQLLDEMSRMWTSRFHAILNNTPGGGAKPT
jgi:hypothetical protein